MDSSAAPTRLIELRASGGGFSGNGCVGEVFSPGTVLCGTGRSSMPNIGSPVTRSKMNSRPILLICATAGIVLPSSRHVDQRRRRAEIVVPDVVMHELLVPLPLAGRDVDGDQRGAVEVVARPVDADVVAAGDRHRDVDDAALLVDRSDSPTCWCRRSSSRHRYPTTCGWDRRAARSGGTSTASAPVRTFHARITGVGRRRDQHVLVDRRRRLPSARPSRRIRPGRIPGRAGRSSGRAPAAASCDETKMRAGDLRVARPVRHAATGRAVGLEFPELRRR